MRRGDTQTATTVRAISHALAVLFFSAGVGNSALRQITCPSGEKRLEIEVGELAIRYEGSTLSVPLAGLGVLAPRLTIDTKPLQQAAVATQQWNELLKGLAEGWNKCVLSKEDYKRGLERIYPRLKEDAADLEKIRQAVIGGQQVNDRRLRELLDNFNANLRSLALLGDRELVLNRIASIVDEKVGEGTEKILSRLAELELRLVERPLAKPEEVHTALGKRLQEKAKIAEAKYAAGYDLFERFRFREAIVAFEDALSAVKLPEFYSSLASALLQVGDLQAAEVARSPVQQTF